MIRLFFRILGFGLYYSGFLVKNIFKFEKKLVVFDLASEGQLQFFLPTLKGLIETGGRRNRIYISYRRKSELAEIKQLQYFRKHRNFIRLDHLRMIATYRLFKIDLFLTTEQYNLGLNNVYSICLFHGQSSKGVNFTNEIIRSFDAFFLHGPLQRKTFFDYIEEEFGECPEHIDLYNIGFPKSDEVINQKFQRIDTLRELNLEEEKKTVLYAPAFNEHASLREFGLEIINILGADSDHNVIVKLPVDCLEPTSNFYATGGIDWFEEINGIEKKYRNVRLYRGLNINRCLACSDLLITCVSSISFEFFVLGKPVLFIDTPDFFNKYLKQRYPLKNTSQWIRETTKNAGREFGTLVHDLWGLGRMVQKCLSNPEDFAPDAVEMQKRLLYNPGTSVEAAVRTVDDILNQSKKSRRKSVRINIIGAFFNRIKPGKRLFRIIQKIFQGFGYKIEKRGQGYIDARQVIRLARKHKASICEYLEDQKAVEFPRKKGRRDRIINKMRGLKIFKNCREVCEIGAGTGMYLEKILQITKPARYEVYETDKGWRRYLMKTYGRNREPLLKCHAADGHTLSFTPSSSCDLVHAHAVFVYIPVLQVLEYLAEAARVCKPGGHVVFDCIPDTDFGLETAQRWLSGEWRFPVILPEPLLREFMEGKGLEVIDLFREIYGSSHSTYFVLKKRDH